MQIVLGKHWHHLGIDQVEELLETRITNGLDMFEVNHRLERFGENRIEGKEKESPILRFLKQFNNPLMILLIISSIVTAVVKDLLDAGIIFGAVLVNALVSYLQESRAEAAIEALASSLASDTTVVRAGESRRLAAAQLVPGDIVLLNAGDRVPADLRIVRSKGLQISEAALTGESVPADKTHDVQLPMDTLLADRRNMAYSSTLVTSGTGTGVVTATGANTEIGRISQLISAAEQLQTPLTKKIAQFSQQVLVGILILAGGVRPEGRGQFDFKRPVAQGPEACNTFGASLHECLGPLYARQHPGARRTRLRGKHALKGKNHVVRAHRAPVKKKGVIAQIEPVRAAVSRQRPRARQIRAGLQLLVKADQSAEELGCNPGAVKVHNAGRIKRGGILLQTHIDPVRLAFNGCLCTAAYPACRRCAHECRTGCSQNPSSDVSCHVPAAIPGTENRLSEHRALCFQPGHGSPVQPHESEPDAPQQAGIAQLLYPGSGLGELQRRKIKPVQVFLKLKLKHAQLISRVNKANLDHVPAKTPGGLEAPVPRDQLIGAVDGNGIHEAARVKAVHQGLQITQLHAHSFFYRNLIQR